MTGYIPFECINKTKKLYKKYKNDNYTKLLKKNNKLTSIWKILVIFF